MRADLPYGDRDIDAFWSKVDISDKPKDCWTWKGAMTPLGYGNMQIDGKFKRAHRFVWEILNFDIPKGFVVMHLCDNPRCCNPSHLALGTRKANTFDMIKKGRDGFKKNTAIGTKNPNAKITDDDAVKIREEYAAGLGNQYQLAEKYGITQTAVGSIIRRKTWRHV